MIDLHVHILPGVDDGAADLSEALDMAQLAYESGVKRLVATPHSNQVGRFENYYSKELKEIYQQFCSALEEEKIPLRVDLGMEIFASEDMTGKILQQELIDAGVLPADYDFEAHKKLVPMQPGDVPVTYADTSALEADLGFRPNTPLRVGLRKFAQWYKEFYKV